MGGLGKQIVATLVATVLASSQACAGYSLLLSQGDGGEPVLCIPVEEGSRFHLDFINSIYLAPVRETFEYDPPSGISLVSVESPSPGVFEYYGLMTDGTAKADLRRVLGEWVRLLSHDYRHHRIATGDRIFNLKDYAVNGSPLIIRARAGNKCAAGE